MGKIKDLTGYIIPDSNTEVLEFVEIKNHAAYWKCKCGCGNIFIARGADISNGHTRSCGCLSKQKAKELGNNNKGKRAQDLTDKRFGKLIARYPTEKRDSCRSIIWACECDCGNWTEVSTHALNQGTVKSCGCLKSNGELKIAQLLLENNIPFETQKSFEGCRFPDTNALAHFDFFVNQSYLIEYDGIQHFDIRFGWNNEEIYHKTQERDKFKTQWCKDHNIPLIRIPYTKYDSLTIEDLKM